MRHPILTAILIVLSGCLRLVKFLFSIVAAIVLVSTSAFIGIYFLFARDLPDIRTLEDYRPQVISEAFSDDGTKIGEFWTECRIFTPYKEIPKLVVQAFIDSEDSRFFDHKGVDMRSIARAFVANLRAGGITQGGSTITQQITRSLLLTRERTITRKVKEAILATRIERHLNKEQILTLYLNQIYLGNRAYGVAAAARNYFRKPLNELTLGQIALIAGLPTAPTNFSPLNNSTEARNRQIHVLRRMEEEGHIEDEDVNRALKESFTVYVAGTDKEWGDKDAAWFTEHVRRIVKEKYGDEILYNKGLKIYTTVNLPMQRTAVSVIRKGIESLDRRLGYRGPLEHVGSDEITERARQLGNEILAAQGASEIAWPPKHHKESTPTSIIFTTGDTYKAIVTGFDDKNTNIQIGDVSGVIKLDGLKWARKYIPATLSYEGAAFVNAPKAVLTIGDVILVRRLDDGTFALAQEPLIQSALVATDIPTGYLKAMVGGYDFAKSEFNRANQALRQPGSSFKPFVYAAALDKGYTENTTIIDSPVTFHVGRNEFWTPKNYGGDYKGATSFRNCIVFSRNIPTAKIVYDIGTHYLTAYERKMGMTTPIGKYLSMALGANGVYLQEMVQAYSVFPRQGVFKPAIAITKIEDSSGKMLESVSPDEAKPEATSISEEVGEAGGELRPDTKVGKNISEDELNTELFNINRLWIERDGLNLTDLELKTLYGTNIPSGHVITPQTAYIMVDMMKGVVTGGTGTRVRDLGKPAAGKTGTTNDETDVWFIGYVPDLAAGVWVGFDELQKIGGRATGGQIAAPIFTEFMKLATEGWEAKDFPKPEDFPSEDIGDLAGGSSLFGSTPKTALPGMYNGGAGGGDLDRAGEFFEEDFESFR